MRLRTVKDASARGRLRRAPFALSSNGAPASHHSSSLTAVVGFLFRPMVMWERVLVFVAGASLVMALPWTDEVGFALAFLWFIFHWWKARKEIAPA